jgi:hypothetical protein
VDEKASRADSGAAVADLAGRVGSLEDSLGHLAQARSVPLLLLPLLRLLLMDVYARLAIKIHCGIACCTAHLPPPSSRPMRRPSCCLTQQRCRWCWLQSDSGMKTTLGSLQQAVGQLKTAVVALELRPPLGGDAAQGADCLQVWVRLRSCCAALEPVLPPVLMWEACTACIAASVESSEPC